MPCFAATRLIHCTNVLFPGVASRRAGTPPPAIHVVPLRGCEIPSNGRQEAICLTTLHELQPVRRSLAMGQSVVRPYRCLGSIAPGWRARCVTSFNGMNSIRLAAFEVRRTGSLLRGMCRPCGPPPAGIHRCPVLTDRANAWRPFGTSICRLVVPPWPTATAGHRTVPSGLRAAALNLSWPGATPLGTRSRQPVLPSRSADMAKSSVSAPYFGAGRFGNCPSKNFSSSAATVEPSNSAGDSRSRAITRRP